MQITNLVPGESAGRILDLSTFFDGIHNHSHESLGISAWVHPVVNFNLPPTRARDLVPAVEVTRNGETLDSERNNLASDSDLTYEMRNLVPGEPAGRFSDLFSFVNEIDNHQGGHEPLVHLNLPPIRTRDHITRHVSNNDHSPLVPAAEVTLNEETLDSELNNLASDSDLTYEGYLELQERMGRVGSRLSEEKIMQHMRITCYTTTTTKQFAQTESLFQTPVESLKLLGVVVD
ncbi:hypothetical protein ACET3Z_016368 [Daucus carota]